MALLEGEANASRCFGGAINLLPSFNIQRIPANPLRAEPGLYHARSLFGLWCQQFARKLDPGAWRCLLMLSLLLSMSGGGAEISRAAQVKAVFLFNFTQFTEWPPEAFADHDAPFVIGILGEDPFTTFLDDTVKNETVRGRHIKVERYRTVTELKSCHILYLGLSTPAGVQRALKAIKGKPVMAVSDNDESAKPFEATINFLT